MFGLFKKNPHDNHEENTQDKTYETGSTNIFYKSDLIRNMKEDHKKLLNLFGDLKQASESKKFNKVSPILKIFRAELEDHLIKENVHLYIYLIQTFKSDEMTSKLINNFRKEMNEIASVALQFLDKYEKIGDEPDLQQSFLSELIEIGKVLGNRIEREENTLYTLYAPKLGPA